MNVFDLHCDTATAAFDAGKKMSGFDLPLDRAPYGRWVQVFAVFLSDSVANALTRFRGVYQFAKRDAEFYVCEPIFSVENAGKLLCEDVENRLDNDLRGIKMLSLGYNADGPLCGGCRGANVGLTQLGIEVMARAQRRGIIIDCSHCSDATFDDIARHTAAPFVASHSLSRAVCDHPRNLTDDRLKVIFDMGGLVGLNFFPEFLGKNPLDALYKNIDRMLGLGGENCIAIGSDTDGAPLMSCCKPHLGELYGDICETFGQRLADKIFYQNAASFMGYTV